jgi:LPXTG-site transpeptidase (sortase) family protein
MSDDAQHRGPSGWASRVLLAAGLVLVVVGGLAWWLQSPSASPVSATDPASTPTSTTAPAGQEVVEPVTLPRAKRVQTEPGAPERLVVPALSIAAPVVPIAAPGGVLTPPSDPQTLGWWADGARPGAAQGSALVTGHTVHSGGGAMDDLEQLVTGDRVWMETDRGRIGYDVRRVSVLGKGELAQRAEELFDQEVPGRLVLITCEDWNGVEYLSNVVVTATPVAA